MIRLNSIEFFTFEDEVWYRAADGAQHRLRESDDMVRLLYDRIADFYPEALAKLEERHGRFNGNIFHYRYRIVRTFCKCNFGAIDNIPDVDSNGMLHFEHVPCPLRGECSMEGVVCHPVFNSQLSAAELRVLELLYRGHRREDIADKLCLSQHTVSNHIRNAFERAGVHKESEFITYANTHNLFPVK